MKLLLIAPTCDGTDVGEAWVAYQWVKRLAERHDVTLLTYHKRTAPTATEQFPELRVVEWPEPALFARSERLNSMLKPGYLPFHARARRWIRQALAAGERFDLAHQPVPVAMRYPSPAAGLGIPLVIGPVGGGLASPPGFAQDEGSTPWYVKLREIDALRRRYDPLLRRTYAGADCVLGIADYVRDQLCDIRLRRFEVMSETGLDSLPEPVDRSEHGGPLKLLFVGRLVRTKGARDLIAALGQLDDVPLQLDVVGEGPDRAACEALAATLASTGRVTFHGWRSKTEVAEFYRRADVFVFPSYREPGGNVALEAMGHCLPLIVVDRGGPGSAVTRDCAIKLAAISPAQLSGELAAAIRRLADDAPRRLAMGAAARRHVERTGLWSAKVDRMDEIYASVVAAHGADEPTYVNFGNRESPA